MRTLVVIPCMDSVPTQFCQSLAMMHKEGECAIAFQMGSLIYMSRNELALKAIKMEADYVLWLDSDMVFEPEIMSQLFETMKKTGADIVSGLYFKRVPPYEPVLFKTFSMDEDGEPHTEKITEIPSEPFSADGVGFGCVLMSTDVLIGVMAKFGNMFAPIGNVGEDIAFCYRAAECGYKIVVDPNIRLGHVGHYVVTEELYEAMRKDVRDS